MLYDGLVGRLPADEHEIHRGVKRLHQDTRAALDMSVTREEATGILYIKVISQE